MKKKKSVLKIIAYVLVLSLSLTILQPISVFAEQNISSSQTTLEKWVPSEEDMRLPNTKGDLTLEQLETAKLLLEDTPEIVSSESIESKGHVNRLWEQEQDLNTVIFQNKDGTKTAYYYSDPVKYTDKNGKVKDKKNKLSETENGEYTNAENDINAYFPKKLHKNKGVELKFGEYVFEMSPNINGSSGASRQTGHDKDKNPTEYVEYPEVFADDISLRYTPTFGGYKEDIILNKNVGINRFEFKLTTNGLSLVQASTGNYYLAEPLTGEYVTALGNVIVYDNTGVESEGYNHYYEVTTISQDEQYLITVIVDEDYLESNDTVYPVYVDPTLTVMPQGDVEDAVLYSNDSETAYSGLIKIGYDAAYGTGRGLYDFPILNFTNDFILMYGNQIKSAELNLYAQIQGSDRDNAKNLSLYEFHSDWSPSTVKWNNTNPYNYSTLVSSKSVTTGWTAFNILPVIEKFKSDSDYTMAFKGLLLKANSETYTTWKKFVSSYGTSSRRPYITITYNDSPTACSQVVSGATYYLKNYNGDYLDVYNGNTLDNTRLLTYAFHGNANQQFKITNISGGEYEIAPQHTSGKVLSTVIDDDGKYRVIIEEDCNLSRQRWYIYYRNGSYHIVNKAYNSGVMAPTYDTDYVSINNEYEYCCWEIQGITVSGNWVPTSTVAKLADALGFLYDPNQDITYSKINAWQRNVGYCWTYDMSAILISSYIDSERFYFNYNGKEYMIEIWKGQYGIQTGAEIGVYYRNVGERDWKDSLAGSGDPGVSSRWYQCADNNNLLEMSFVLKKGNSIILQRGFEEHWWLTGFKWGMFTENPNDLSMSISLIFADEGMKNAFVGSGNSRNLRGRGYSYSSEVKDGKYTISFDFKIPKSPQPSTMHNYASGIQNNNEVLVNAYNVVMTTLNIENNDLNSINESAILSSSNQALKNAYLTIKEYMNTEMATMERYNLN